MPKGKIFISYRRDSGAAAARLLREALCSRRFPVFMDVEDLRAGQYRDILSSQVEACSDFILVLTPGSLERCLQEGDWVAREVAEALRLKKNIVPVSFEEVNWPEDLPPDMVELRDFQVCRLSNEYFSPSVHRLIECLSARPRSAKPVLVAAGVLALLAALAGLAFWTGKSLLARSNTHSSPPTDTAAKFFSQLFVLHGPGGPEEIADLGDATLELQASVPGSGDWSRRLSVGAQGRINFDLVPPSLSNQAATVKLTAKDWELNVPRGPALRLSGHTLYLPMVHKPFTLQGTVKDKDNKQPAAGAWVSLEGFGTNTDLSGQFRLNIPGPLWRPKLELGITNPGWIPLAFPIQHTETPVEILCERAPFTQVVRLLGPNGASGAGLPAGALLKLQAEGLVFAGRIGPEGEARFDDLAPALQGKPAVFTLEFPGWQVKAGQGAVLVGEAPIPLEVERWGRTVSGRVLEAEQGQALKGAWVSVAGLSTNTDAGGAFRLFVPMERLRSQPHLVVTNTGYQPTNLTLGPSSDSLDIRLRKPGPFAFVVSLTRSGNGPPLAGPTNGTLRLKVGGESFETVVGEQGQARFPALPRTVFGKPAVVSLDAEGWQLAGGQASILLSDKPAAFDVERTGAWFTGRVRDEGDGLPVPEVRITIGGVVTNTDQGGQFALFLPGDRLQAPIVLKASRPEWEDANREVTVDVGPLDLPLKRREAKPAEPPSQEGQRLRAEADQNPGSPNAHYDYGNFLRDARRLPEAQAELANAAELAGRQGLSSLRALSLNSLGLVYDDQGKHALACRAYDDAVGLFRDQATETKSVRDRSNLARSLRNRGLAHRALFNLPAALKDLKEALSWLEGLPPSEAGRASAIAETHTSLADIEFEVHNRDSGLGHLAQAKQAYEAAGMDKPDSPMCDGYGAMLNNYACRLDDRQDWKTARGLFEKAIRCLQAAAQANRPGALEDLAMALWNLGGNYEKTQDWAPARDQYAKTLDAYQRLAKITPAHFRPREAETSAKLGDTLARLKDRPGALERYQAAVQIYRELAKSDPLRFDDEAAGLLHKRAQLFIDEGRNRAARTELEESLELYKQLTRTEGWTNRTDYARALHCYAVCLNDQAVADHSSQQDFKTALEAINKALAIFRKDAAPGQEADIADTLRNRGMLLRNARDYKGAHASYSDALPLENRLAKELPDIHGPKLCQLRLDLVQVCLDLQDTGRGNWLPEAQEHFAAAQRIEKGLPKSSSPANFNQEMADLDLRLRRNAR
ncbi:MAG: TIR domain-containing protein [Limisphaerales bacterium]